MSRVGQNRRRDAIEPAIVAALEAAGVNVFRISGVGIADLLCYYRGQWLPMEVKSKGGTLTTAQLIARLHAPYPIVQSEDEALALFGIRL